MEKGKVRAATYKCVKCADMIERKVRQLCPQGYMTSSEHT
jgi:hypothetical protein